MSSGDTFLNLHNAVGHLRSIRDELTGLLALNVLNETDDKQTHDAIDVITTLLEGFEQMSHHYLQEEN